MNKEMKLLKELEKRIGNFYAGYIISHLIDCLDDYTKEGDRYLRKITITLNDYFEYPLELKENDK